MDTSIRTKSKDGGKYAKCTLFVRGIPEGTLDSDFSSFFSDFGPVRSAFVVRRRKTDGELNSSVSKKKSKVSQIGFVHFALPEDSQKALQAISLRPFGDQKVILKADPAVRKGQSCDDDKPRSQTIYRKKSDGEDKISIKKSKNLVKSSRSMITIQLIGSRSSPEKQEDIKLEQKQLYKRIRKIAPVISISKISSIKANQVYQVTFVNSDQAVQAATKLDGKIYKGQTIKVQSQGSTEISAKSSRSGEKNHRLIIRNLPFKGNVEESLRNAFSAFGKILELTLPKTNDQNRLSGFAFVSMQCLESATNAMEALNGTTLSDRPIAIDWAVTKSDHLKELSSKSIQYEDNIDDSVSNSVEEGAHSKMDEPGCSGTKGSENMNLESINNIKVGNDCETMGESAAKSSFEECDNESTRLKRTVFIRNVPFSLSEKDLESHLVNRFGPVDMIKLVKDSDTGIAKGSAFAIFSNYSDASKAVAATETPNEKNTTVVSKPATFIESMLHSISSKVRDLCKRRTGKLSSTSVNNFEFDSTKSAIVIDGRTLEILPAVDKTKAEILTRLGKRANSYLDGGPQDNRNLALLSEGTIRNPSEDASKFWAKADVEFIDATLFARRKEMKKNPNISVSDSRLSIRHIPLTVTEAEIKSVLKTALKSAMSSVPPIVDAKLAPTNSKPPFITQVKMVLSKEGRPKGFAFAQFTHKYYALLTVRYLMCQAPNLWRKILAGPFAVSRHTEAGKTFRTKAPLVEFATDKSAVIKRRLSIQSNLNSRDTETFDGESDTRSTAKIYNAGKSSRKPKKVADDAENLEKSEPKKNLVGINKNDSESKPLHLSGKKSSKRQKLLK